MLTETTLRDIWLWLTTEVWNKLQVIKRAPLDAPLSYWGDVIAAGMIWLIAFYGVLFLIVKLSYDAHVEWEDGREKREKQMAALKGQYERTRWGWRKKGRPEGEDSPDGPLH